MALARMTAESRALLSQLARGPLDLSDKPAAGEDGARAALAADLSTLGFAERREGRWQITRSGKEYMKTQR